MSDLRSDLRLLAMGWLNAKRDTSIEAEGQRLSQRYLGSTALLVLSREIRELSEARIPQVEVLERASDLFDRLCAQPWAGDEFGERYEVCHQLSFVAWRHAYAIGLDADAQAWQRTAEFLTQESATAFDCAAAFLALPARDRSPSLWAATFRHSADVFLALCLMRRERFRSTSKIAAIAADAYAWIRSNPPSDSSNAENEYFLGEFAYLASSCQRYLRRLGQTRVWQFVAHRHFRRCTSSRPLRLKLRLERLLVTRDLHSHDYFRRHIPALAAELGSCGMYREWLTCRLALAITDRVTGKNRQSLAACHELLQEWASSSEHEFLSRVYGNIGEVHASFGEFGSSRDALKHCLEEAEQSSDSLSIANAWAYIGAAILEEGDRLGSARAFREAIQNFGNAGSECWRAYCRILLAEVLVALDQLQEARAELLQAVPIVQRERMIPETIHALKLLSEISKSWRASGDRDANLGRRFHEGSSE